MAKDPAVLLYTADFLVGSMTMTDEQVGKYIRLLCLQHQKGHLTEGDMLNVCRERDEIVYEKFVLDEDGRYYNRRMESEIDKRSKSSDASRGNGSKGGRPKKQIETHEEPKENLQVYDRFDFENLSVNENENINEIRTEGDSDNSHARTREEISEARFDEFWSAYPNKTGKGAARKAWGKIKPSAELHRKMLKAIADAKDSDQWQREDGRYIPNPSTWLNQSRWEDELKKKGDTANGANREHTGGGFRPSTGFRRAEDDYDDGG